MYARIFEVSFSKNILEAVIKSSSLCFIKNISCYAKNVYLYTLFLINCIFRRQHRDKLEIINSSKFDIFIFLYLLLTTVLFLSQERNILKNVHLHRLFFIVVFPQLVEAIIRTKIWRDINQGRRNFLISFKFLISSSSLRC